MSIADKITSIETHLTNDYEALENIGAELENVDKNIENIASVVNGIYDNLPKTTGEGTNLSLNTLKGKMNIIPKGDTEQDGTPTPSTPIDIEVVTGTQNVKVENVNLLPNNATTQTLNGLTFTKNEDGSVLVNGTATANTQYDLLKARDNVKINAGNYYISGCPSGGAGETYRLVIGVSGTLYGEYGSGRAITISSGVLTSYIYVANGASVSNKLYKPQLEKRKLCNTIYTT